MSNAQITTPLNIPDVHELHTSVSGRGEIIITIECANVVTKCRNCGKLIKKLHSRDEWVLIRHLPAFGRPTHLRYRPNRYQCQDCEGQPVFYKRKGGSLYKRKVAHFSPAQKTGNKIPIAQQRIEQYWGATRVLLSGYTAGQGETSGLGSDRRNRDP